MGSAKRFGRRARFGVWTGQINDLDDVCLPGQTRILRVNTNENRIRRI